MCYSTALRDQELEKAGGLMLEISSSVLGILAEIFDYLIDTICYCKAQEELLTLKQEIEARRTARGA